LWQFTADDRCPQDKNALPRVLTANLTVNYSCDPDGLVPVATVLSMTVANTGSVKADALGGSAESLYQVVPGNPAAGKFATVTLNISRVRYNAAANGDKFTYKIQYSHEKGDRVECGAACKYVTHNANMDPANALYGFKRATHFVTSGSASGRILLDGVETDIVVEFTPPKGGNFALFITTSDGCQDIPRPAGAINAKCTLPAVSSLAPSDGQLIRMWKDATQRFGSVDTEAKINADPPAPYQKASVLYKYFTADSYKPFVKNTLWLGVNPSDPTAANTAGNSVYVSPQASGVTTWKPTQPGMLCAWVEALNECNTVALPYPYPANVSDRPNLKSVCIEFKCKDRKFPICSATRNGVCWKDMTVAQESYPFDIYRNAERKLQPLFKPVTLRAKDLVDINALTTNLVPDLPSILTYEWVVTKVPSDGKTFVEARALQKALSDAMGAGRTTDTATFTPDKPGVYEFTLRVHDTCQVTEYYLRVSAECTKFEGLEIISSVAPRVGSIYFDGLRFPKMLFQVTGRYGGSDNTKFMQSNLLSYTWEIAASPANSIYSASRANVSIEDVTLAPVADDVKEYDDETFSGLYLYSDANDNKCPTDYQQIQDASVCEAAATIDPAPKSYRGVLDPASETSPKGCYLVATGRDTGSVYFNPAITGATVGNTNQRPLCKRTVMTKIKKQDDVLNNPDFTETWKWTQKSRTVTQSNVSTSTYLRNHAQDNSPTTCFHPDQPGAYQLTLTVNDGCSTTSKEFRFLAVCARPTLKFSNVAVDGSGNGRISITSSGVVPARVQLDMSESSISSTYAGVGVLTYAWTILEAPRPSVLSDKNHLKWLTNPHGAVASFIPDQPGLYRFQASIYDGCSDAVKQELSVVVACQQTPTLRVNATVLDTTFRATNVPTGGNAAPYAQVGEFLQTRIRGIYQDQTGNDLSCSAKKWEWTLQEFQCTNPVPMPPPAASNVTVPDVCQAPVMCAWRFAKAPCKSKLTDTNLTASPDNGEGRFAPKVKFKPDVSGVYVLSFSCSDGCSAAEDNVTVYARCRNQFDVARLSEAVAFKPCNSESVFDEVTLTPTITESQPPQGFAEFSKCPITQLTPAPVVAARNAPPKRCCPKCPSCPVCPSCPKVACPVCPACPPFAVCQIVNGVDNCTNAARPMSLQDEQGHAFETTPSRSPPIFDASSRRSAATDSMAVEARVVLEEALRDLSSEQYHDMLHGVETVVATILGIPVESVSVGMEADEKTLIILVQGEDHSRVTATLTEAYSSGNLVFGDAGRAARITVEIKSNDEPVHTLVEPTEEFEADSDSRERVLWLSAVIPMSVLVILSIAANFVFISHYGSLVKGTFRPVSTRSTLHAL